MESPGSDCGSGFSLTIRLARLDDISNLTDLIARSARELSAGDYSTEQVEGALLGAFGGDAGSGRDAAELDPATDAAKIRAFFVDPAYARRGLGSAILERCEAEAGACGFRRFEMMATLPGAKLYARYGYSGTKRIQYEVRPGVMIDFIPMSK